jgi:hypothetical protein
MFITKDRAILSAIIDVIQKTLKYGFPNFMKGQKRKAAGDSCSLSTIITTGLLIKNLITL